MGATRLSETVAGTKINRSSVGGWSQMRYQRHVEKLQKDHAQELVDTLDRIAREESIEQIILAGDEVNVPLVRGLLTDELSKKVIDSVKLATRTPEQEILQTAAEALRRHDAKTDAEIVERVLGDYRAGALAVAGLEETREALANGQVEELYLTAAKPADDLVASARQTSASIRFIEDPELLAGVDGVAASLRYRPGAPPLREGQEIK
jgi:peptide subunit release factor 1 (eRF1)